MASIAIKSYSAPFSQLGTYGGATAVDAPLYHGFVIDPSGFGVMLDTRTGAVLSRFHMNQPASVNIERNLAVVDDRTHRLFVGILPSGRTRQQPLLTVLDTATGRMIRQVQDTWGLLTVAVVLDRRSDRVFVVHYRQHVLVLDGRSGAILTRPHVGNQSYDLAVDAGTGHVFVLASPAESSSYAELRVLDAFGHLLRAPTRTRLSSGAARLVVDSAAHRLILYDGANSTADLFDTSSLQLRRSITVNNDADFGIAVDERWHRVIIAGHGGTMVLDSNG